MKWRPDDWENPYDLYMAGVTIRPNERAEDYEAGADAMLKAVKDLLVKLGYQRVVDDIQIFTLDKEVK